MDGIGVRFTLFHVSDDGVGEGVTREGGEKAESRKQKAVNGW
jgi:hypothetical protein